MYVAKLGGKPVVKLFQAPKMACVLCCGLHYFLSQGSTLMAKKIFPGGVLRGYFLDSKIYSSADDEEYYLCFSSDSEMFALIYYSPNKPYSAGYWSQKIPPSEFGNHAIEGAPLAKLVIEKLSDILPAGS